MRKSEQQEGASWARPLEVLGSRTKQRDIEVRRAAVEIKQVRDVENYQFDIPGR